MTKYRQSHPEVSEHIKQLYYEKHGKHINEDAPELSLNNSIAYNVLLYSASIHSEGNPGNLPGVIEGCRYYGIIDPLEIEQIQRQVIEMYKIEKEMSEKNKR